MREHIPATVAGHRLVGACPVVEVVEGYVDERVVGLDDMVFVACLLGENLHANHLTNMKNGILAGMPCLWGDALYQSRGLGGDALATPCEAETLGGGGLYRHGILGEAEVGGYVGYHGGDVGEHLGCLGDDGDIDVGGAVAALGQQPGDTAQQHARVGALVARVGVGEVVAYVTQGGGAKEGVAEGVEGDVGVAVSVKAETVGYLYPAYPQVAPLDEAVDVKSVSDAYLCHSAWMY